MDESTKAFVFIIASMIAAAVVYTWMSCDWDDGMKSLVGVGIAMFIYSVLFAIVLTYILPFVLPIIVIGVPLIILFLFFKWLWWIYTELM